MITHEAVDYEAGVMEHDASSFDDMMDDILDTIPSVHPTSDFSNNA